MKPMIVATFTTKIGVSRTKKILEMLPVIEVSFDFEDTEVRKFALKGKKELKITTPNITAVIHAFYEEF